MATIRGTKKELRNSLSDDGTNGVKTNGLKVRGSMRILVHDAYLEAIERAKSEEYLPTGYPFN